MSENRSLTGNELADPVSQGGAERDDDGITARADLPPAAQRALREAEERRLAAERQNDGLGRQKEIAGRGGLDPVRYGDWENKGIVSDF